MAESYYTRIVTGFISMYELNEIIAKEVGERYELYSLEFLNNFKKIYRIIDILFEYNKPLHPILVQEFKLPLKAR